MDSGRPFCVVFPVGLNDQESAMHLRAERFGMSQNGAARIGAIRLYPLARGTGGAVVIEFGEWRVVPLSEYSEAGLRSQGVQERHDPSSPKSACFCVVKGYFVGVGAGRPSGAVLSLPGAEFAGRPIFLKMNLLNLYIRRTKL